MKYSKPTNECPVCGGEFTIKVFAPSGASSTVHDDDGARNHMFYHLLEEMADENKEEE